MSTELDLKFYPELAPVVHMLHKCKHELERLGHWDNLEMLAGWVPSQHYYAVEAKLATANARITELESTQCKEHGFCEEGYPPNPISTPDYFL